MKKTVSRLVLFFFVLSALSSCERKPEPHVTTPVVVAQHQPPVLKSIVTSNDIPDAPYYRIAYAGSQNCGISPFTPEAFDWVMQSQGGAMVNDAIAIKGKNGKVRAYTTRHTFIDCFQGSSMIVHSPDVISVPIADSVGFSLGNGIHRGDSLIIKGFRFDGSPQGSYVEWITIPGRASMKDLSKLYDGVNPLTRNTADSVPVIKLREKEMPYLKGFSGAPVFNLEGQVVGIFSGIYTDHQGIFLRLEELKK